MKKNFGLLWLFLLLALPAAANTVCDWSGTEWIGNGKPAPTRDEDFYADDPAPQLRKTFSIAHAVRSARLHIVGLGYYEAQLNGRALADSALAPLWTAYGQRVLYDSFDVTKLLQPGSNALTVTLGNGWFNPLPLRLFGRFNLRDVLACGRPCLRAKLEIVFTDGSTANVVTDPSWKVADGPILRNNVYLGEVYDARKETAGWQQPGFDDTAWRPASPATGPAGALLSRGDAPPIGVRETWPAVKVTEPQPRVFVVDLGRNFAGLARLHLSAGPAGRTVSFRYGELLNADGTVNNLTSVCTQLKRPGMGGPGAPAVAEARDHYVRRGGGDETYLPRFTWHGFRYIEISGLDRAPQPSDIQGVALASALPDACEFECSDPLLNRLHRVCRATFLSNVFGVQSDCPARERFGYGGDIAVTTESFIFNFDMHGFYAKTLQDFADDATDGWFPETAPYIGIGERSPEERSQLVEWAVAVPIMLRDLYRYYGDRDLLAQHYAACARYVDLVQARFPDLIVPHGIGDHEALEKASPALTATAQFHLWAQLVSDFATTLGKTAEAEKYARLADSIRTAFQARFVVGGKVGEGRQGEQLFGLYHRLIPAADRRAALALLKQNIEEKGGALTTGIFSTKYLLEVLSTEGLADLAGKIVTRREFPGWGFMLDHGATTLWETWKPSDNVFSQNHPMFGSVEDWFMKHVLGLAVADDAFGFDRITIRPQAVAGLTWARGTYRSVKGPVHVEWRVVEGKMKLTVELPPGVHAKVWLANE